MLGSVRRWSWVAALAILSVARGQDAVAWDEATLTPLPGPYQQDDGLAWLAAAPAGWASDSPASAGSRLVLLEDGRPLGPAHAVHDEVRRLGAGRYSHWAGSLWFSTSDGSDPNANGRRYTVALSERMAPERERYQPTSGTDVFAGLARDDLARATAGSAVPQRARQGAPPLIYWYTIDALRADTALERDASGEPLMPELAAFAEESVGFARAYATSSFTKTSTASMFTGLWPRRHGVLHGVLPTWPEGAQLLFDLDPRFYTLAELLRDHGYTTLTHAFSVHVQPGGGMLQGFDATDLPADPTATLPADGPLFVYEHVLGLHGPYAPSAAAAEAVGVPAVPGFEPADTSWFEQPLDDARLAALRAAYRAEGIDADAVLGQRLQALRDQGLWDDALIIVTADHGDEFGEHGTTQHSVQLYDEVVRVPLYVKFPSDHRWAAWHGRLLPQRVRLVDLYPTVAELVATEALPYAVDGRSLGPILDREEHDPAARDVLLRASFTRPTADGDLALHTCDAMVQGDRKVLLGHRLQGSQRPDAFGYAQGDWFAELYDLATDPDETRDLSASRRGEVLRLLEHIHASGAPLVAEVVEGDGGFDMDEQLLQQLEALGYVRR